MARNGWWRIAFVVAWMTGAAPATYALDQAVVTQLAAEGGDAKIEAINKLVAAGDAAAIPLLQAMQEDRLQLFSGRLVIVTDAGAKDALTREAVQAPSDRLEAVVINNRVRGALDAAVAALRLTAPERETRRAAATQVAADPSGEMLPLIKRAHERETDAEIKALLAQAGAVVEIKSPDAAVRRQAIKLLATSPSLVRNRIPPPPDVQAGPPPWTQLRTIVLLTTWGVESLKTSIPPPPIPAVFRSMTLLEMTGVYV